MRRKIFRFSAAQVKRTSTVSLVFPNFQRLHESKAKPRLRADRYVAVPCQRSTRRSCACSRPCPNCAPSATACQCADQRTHHCPAPRAFGCTFAASLAGLSVISVALTSYLLPSRVSEVRVTVISAFPLNLPADFALVTVPITFVPLGRITLSPTTTGSAKEASKWSPELLSLELTG